MILTTEEVVRLCSRLEDKGFTIEWTRLRQMADKRLGDWASFTVVVDNEEMASLLISGAENAGYNVAVHGFRNIVPNYPELDEKPLVLIMKPYIGSTNERWLVDKYVSKNCFSYVDVSKREKVPFT